MKVLPKESSAPDPGFVAFVERLTREEGVRPGRLIPYLHRIQDHYHYLPGEALTALAREMGLSLARVVGTASFYQTFRFTPAGKHRIKVCVGTACHVQGADQVYAAFRRTLELAEGTDTDAAGRFTLEKVACLGCCMLAPAVQIDEVTYGPVAPAGVSEILQDFLQLASDRDRQEPSSGGGEAQIRLCTCSSCQASGASLVFAEVERWIRRLDLAARVKSVSCTGLSFQAPQLEIETPDGEVFRYARIAPRHVEKILHRHLRPAAVHHRLRHWIHHSLEVIVEGEHYEPVTRYSLDVRDEVECDFLSSQVRIATERGGVLGPLDLAEYRRGEGFSALERCVRFLSPEEVIAAVKVSALRGRGGGGFATGEKWSLVRAAAGSPKAVIVNGDEGDPGAFMDRMLMESFPFRVIEGMLIAAFATGASCGIIYLRHEYTLAIRRLGEAITLCRGAGLLGSGLFGSSFSFDAEIFAGAGAFVCGEETALISSLEGERGCPRYRPPFPSESGLGGLPTLINNAETLSLIPWILRHGGESFAALGSGKSRGTKTFALAGKVVRGGLIEVPMGMTLRQVVDEIGGGVPGGGRLKAVQIGGPSGGCLPREKLDLPIDYETLLGEGAILGSGGLIVLDEEDCMVDIARYFLSFCREESCGKCTFCRVGITRMGEILDRITAGKGTESDLLRLEELASAVKAGSLCGLGRSAPNPVLSTLRFFREEYEAHLAGRCPALVCRALIRYRITPRCHGCTRCAQVCPAGAIRFDPLARHAINDALCLRCDACREVCPAKAIEVIS